MRAKTINEFKRGLDPRKAMGTGLGGILIYNIREENDEYIFSVDNEAIEKYIKKCIPSISKNEIDRFCAFTLQDIYDSLSLIDLKNKDEKALTDFIRQQIESRSRYWIGMHSDKAMNRMNR